MIRIFERLSYILQYPEYPCQKNIDVQDEQDDASKHQGNPTRWIDVPNYRKGLRLPVTDSGSGTNVRSLHATGSVVEILAMQVGGKTVP